MKICIFGASGGVGKQIVAQALEQGLSVKAIYRSSTKVNSTKNFEIVIRSDILNEKFVATAIEDVEVVVSALGLRRKNPSNPWSKVISPPHLTSDFAKVLVKVMRERKFNKKVIAISAGGVGESWSRISPPLKILLGKSNIGVGYKDLNQMELLFRESNLDWICVRPTTLTNSVLTKKIRIVETYRFTSKISRSDVAWFVLQQIKNSGSSDRTPMIEA